MLVHKGKGWIAVTDFFPKSPDAEIAFAHIGVVKQDHAPIAHPGQPGFEVVLDRFIRMEAVNVKQVNRPVGEMVHGLVEGTREQARKAAVERVVMAAQVRKDLGTVEAALWIALPGIDGIR